MSDATPPSAAYAAEIRAWMIGRIEKNRTIGEIRRAPAALPTPRVQWWWILEGKRYPWLQGSLLEMWPDVLRHARRLLQTHNLAWRLVDSPEGETDWIASAFHTMTARRRTFVSRASRAGLHGDEREALMGWLKWVVSGSQDYPAAVEMIGLDSLATAAPSFDGYVDGRRLRRWAHTAKRSRWPLLRNVVAESLRCVLEPQELDRIPLPSDHARLFELLCLVRILEAIGDTATHVRWVDKEAGENSVLTGSTTCSLQVSLPREEVLATSVFDHGLRIAMDRHKVRAPKYVDLWVEFDQPRGGFAAILVEAKSGGQSPDSALLQLLAYRSVLRSRIHGRLLVWGIVERDLADTEAALSSSNLSQTDPSEDLWAFSSADQIPLVMHSLGLCP